MSENSLGTWFLSLSSFLGQSLKKKTKCSVPFRLQYDPPLSVPSLCLYTKQTLCLSNNNHWLAWHPHPKLGQVILELCAEARHTCTCKQKTKMCQGLYLTKPGSNIYACDKSGSSLKKPDIRPRRISLLYPQSPNYLRGHSTGLQTHLVTEKNVDPEFHSFLLTLALHTPWIHTGIADGLCHNACWSLSLFQPKFNVLERRQ